MLNMRAMHGWWREIKATEQREMDERAMHLQLLAYRDGFVALIALLLVAFVLTLAVRQSRLEGGWVAARALSLSPAAAAIFGMLVFHVSWRMRGGGVGTRVAAVRAASLFAGYLVALGLAAGLSLAGLIDVEVSIGGWLAGFALSSALGFLLIRRRDGSQK